MIAPGKRSLVSRAWLVGGMGAAAVVVAACGTSTQASSASAPQTSASASSPASSAAPSSAAPSSASAGKGVEVETHSGAMGTFLTDSAGRTLYLFASDTATKSTCSGQCAVFWPPLVTKGAPEASGGAMSNMLGTITRSGGVKQVTYNGHPLYFFKEDTKPGDTNGQGSNNFGAKWWLVTPTGKSITSAGGSAPKASPTKTKSGGSGGGGGGGGWG